MSKTARAWLTVHQRVWQGVRKIVFLGLCLCLGMVPVVSLATSLASASPAPTSASTPTSAPLSSDAKPKIIALSPHIVELLFDIGAGEQIVATTEFADYPQAAQQIPVIGNYAGLKIEAILALQPDLIIAWRGGNVQRDLEKLRTLGFNIIYSQPLTLLDVAKDLRLFGLKTGNAQRAEQQAQIFEQRVAQLAQTYRHAAPVLAFYEIWHAPLTTVAQNGWAHNLLGICNIQNAFADISHPYPQVNIEQVLSKQVQLIIQPQSGLADAGLTDGETNPAKQPHYKGYNWQAWSDIPAVKHNRILRPNADKLHRMTLRTLDELGQLCAQVHGETG